MGTLTRLRSSIRIRRLTTHRSPFTHILSAGLSFLSSRWCGSASRTRPFPLTADHSLTRPSFLPIVFLALIFNLSNLLGFTWAPSQPLIADNFSQLRGSGCSTTLGNWSCGERQFSRIRFWGNRRSTCRRIGPEWSRTAARMKYMHDDAHTLLSGLASL